MPFDSHMNNGELGAECKGLSTDSLTPPLLDRLRITRAELANSSLTPRCIVADHTYADVAQLVAPGGTGKTTLLLYEAICMAVKRRVYGLEVVSPGWTLIVTAEDARERIVARLREILLKLELTDEERWIAVDAVRIWDVTGLGVKLIRVVDGNIIMTTMADEIVNAYRADPPAVIIFDPLVSFGAAEGMVNDNEQGLIMAARRIVKGLGCCVRFVHHTGKSNGREMTLDQYSGRGGSALADGSRMTSVLQAWSPGNGSGLKPPPGCTPHPDASIMILARPKLSYAKPNLPLIWIRRIGWKFETFIDLPKSKDEIRADNARQLERFLVSELAAGNKHTRTTLDALYKDIRLTREEGRAALAVLMARGNVVEADLPQEEKQGQRKTYLQPQDTSLTRCVNPQRDFSLVEQGKEEKEISEDQL